MASSTITHYILLFSSQSSLWSSISFSLFYMFILLYHMAGPYTTLSVIRTYSTMYYGTTFTIPYHNTFESLL